MPIVKAIDWKGTKPIGDFISDYSVYPELTKKLDAHDWTFNDSIISEIVLWKLNRFVKIPALTHTALNDLRNLKRGQHKAADKTLTQLLKCKGVRLPMASTFLRFANPEVFQIYDRHICRALYGKFQPVAPKKPSEAVEIYWEFLDELIKQCGQMKIQFKEADRILFEFDKIVNPPLSGSED